MKKTHIRLDIGDTCINKKNIDLLFTAEKTVIGHYPEDLIHVYADGSAFKIQGNLMLAMGYVYNSQAKHVRNFLIHVERNAQISKRKQKL